MNRVNKKYGIANGVKAVIEEYKITFLDGSIKIFNTLEGADLEGADLRYADLCKTDLRRANLKGADLRFASLKGANLEGANLEGAILAEANLSWANLRNAILKESYLAGANLSGADLEGSKGVVSFTSGKHLAVAFQYNDKIYINIGGMTLEDPDWLEHFELVARWSGYTDKQIQYYRSFIQQICKVGV